MLVGGVSRLCGVSSLCGVSRLLGYSGDSNLLLHVLGDVESGAVAGEEVPLMCNHCESPCS